jgi:hypothetical protein
MHPVTRKVESWKEIAPQDLPEAIATQRPLCADCTLAESFCQRFPERVTYRRPH